jgi:hypothetical protein
MIVENDNWVKEWQKIEKLTTYVLITGFLIALILISLILWCEKCIEKEKNKISQQ